MLNYDATVAAGQALPAACFLWFRLKYGFDDSNIPRGQLLLLPAYEDNNFVHPSCSLTRVPFGSLIGQLTSYRATFTLRIVSAAH